MLEVDEGFNQRPEEAVGKKSEVVDKPAGKTGAMNLVRRKGQVVQV